MKNSIELIQKQINSIIKAQGKLLSNSISNNTKLDFLAVANEMIFLLKETNINEFIKYFEESKKEFMDCNDEVISAFFISLEVSVCLLKALISNENTKEENSQTIKTSFSNADIEDMCFVMNAFANGENIVYRLRSEKEWFLVSNPKWNWKDCEYDIQSNVIGTTSE